MLRRFEGMNTQVVGVSVDHIPCLKAWAESLGGISFPLASDFWPHGAAAREWGVFRESDGITERAVFVVDASGVIRYANVHDIAEQPDNDVLFSVLATLEPEAAGRMLAGPSAAAEPLPTADAVELPVPSGQPASVVMYCRSWCPDCRRARDWLTQKGIEFVEIDVDHDAEARARAESLNEGRLHTPTFEVGPEKCVDFQPDRLRQLLDLP